MNATERRNVIWLALKDHYRWHEKTNEGAVCQCGHMLRPITSRLWEETTDADLDGMHQNHMSGVIERAIRSAS